MSALTQVFGLQGPANSVVRLGLLAKTGKKKDAELLRTTGTTRMCVYYIYIYIYIYI